MGKVPLTRSETEWPKPGYPYSRLAKCRLCEWFGHPDYFWTPPYGWISACPKCGEGSLTLGFFYRYRRKGGRKVKR